MNEDLKKQLEGFGFTPEQIKALEDEGVQTAEDMGELEFEDIVAITKARTLTCRKAYNAFRGAPSASVAPAPAAPVMPTNIVLKTGRPEDMPYRELLQAIADGETDPTYLAAVERYAQGRRIFVKNDEGTGLDVTESLELYSTVGTSWNVPQFWGSKPTMTLTEALDRYQKANPVTGNLLVKGDPMYDLSEDRLILLAFAAITGQLPFGLDEWAVADELKQATLQGRWIRVEASYNQAKKQGDPRVSTAESRIRFKQGGAGRSSEPFRG